MSRLVAYALIAAALAGAGLTAGGADAQPLPTPSAQLQGTFHMTGSVTVAENIRGERVGDVAQRTWTFAPLCPTGPCATVQLIRQRATGTDTLVLHAVGPTAYAGKGRFYAPLRCTGRIYRPGQAVPFKITVQVSATAPSVTGTVVTAITAAYVNQSRLNLTPCIGVLGHDSAAYIGQLVG
ncbi:MAG: hypothetical protein JO262_15675 [Solirubrobacterales bacterium]|nr:hypothetical protein [Solirubrobacterales bacterium]MBV9943565.1 hypothetical protein [Solirubrobacterales bacterium]